MEAQTAFEAGAKLQAAGQYNEAVPLVERALALREAVLGGTHPDVASCLNVLGELHWWQGKYAHVESLLLRALAIREAALGNGHPGVASTLNNLANHYTDLGFYHRAAPLYQRALAIREAALGKGHPDVASSLSNLAHLYQFQGLYRQAEPLYQRALAIREAALGKSHPDVAASLNSLAAIHQLQGRYSRAEPLYKRALAVYETALGKKHLLVAYSLSNLAFLYQDQGLYDRAAQLYERALPVYEASLGKEHPKVADSLYTLAQLYDSQGLYGQSGPLYERVTAIIEATLSKDDAEAAALLINLSRRIEPLYERALAISEEAALGKTRHRVSTSLGNLAHLYNQEMMRQVESIYERMITLHEVTIGKHHPDVAAMLIRFANFYLDYVDQGSYSRAEPLVQRALAIQEATFGQNHPQVAESLDTLTLIYQRQGLYSQAEPLQKRALAIWEAALGPNHPDIASSLTEFARTYQHQGQYDRAERLQKRALAIREAALGKNHPDIASSLHHLAGLYQAQGLYARAAPLLQRALIIQEAALGKNHPDVAFTLNTLAQLRLAQQRLAEALPLFTRAFEISERLLRHEVLDFSESHLARFLQFLRADEERLHALLREHPGDARVQRLALTAVLLRKGRSTEETASISRMVYRSLGPQDRETFDLLRSLRTQLAKLSLDGHSHLAPSGYQERLKDLAEQGDALEAALARRSAPLRALSDLPPPNEIVDRVAAALPKNGALVEFITYTDRPLVPKPGTPESQLPTQLRYLALVLFPDSRIRSIDLGPAAPIDQAASSLRNALARRDTAFQAPAQDLYALAFKPLLPLLGDSRRLFLSPDGQLALVPFSALHDGHSFLIDSFDFSYVTSGKDLLPRPSDIPSSSSVIVLADPDFSSPLPPPSSSQMQAAALPQRSAALEHFFSTLRADVAEQAWAPLPGTRLEAQSIQRLLPQAQLFLGPEASKQQLLQLAAPGVLHIATHGFFLEDAHVPTGSRGLGHIGSGGTPAQPPPDPLLRSGLVLSGAHASVPATPESTRSRADSALVTALELAGLDLWGTQLVVLSACDTGRGDVTPGQGVYGLRRALVTAGAETVVMSLWKVNDDTTRLLMEAYYRYLLEGQGRVAALRQAMLSLREKQPHPYFWAPFISLGRDAPLRALTPAPR
ncbi:MAG TPA: CHAT domain-containing tetratricopeptide repeat protein [Hyalangium sp.]|nr:CHAT domain-containing tetratricopeptide repeat protein [Hyalangium sp.]